VDLKGENKFKENMSWVLIALTFFSFVLNLSISLKISLLSLYKDIKIKYKDIENNISKRRSKERKEKFLELLPE
jgi:hypothetical protein